MEISEDRMTVLRMKISGWIRQSRHRAKRDSLIINISLEEVLAIYKEYEYSCAYCGAAAGSPDFLFPLKDKGPCVTANVVPCCDACRNKKSNHNVVWFYSTGYLPKEQMHKIITGAASRTNGDLVKELIKSNVTPMG
jgi:hypothetical protein